MCEFNSISELLLSEIGKLSILNSSKNCGQLTVLEHWLIMSTSVFIKAVSKTSISFTNIMLLASRTLNIINYVSFLNGFKFVFCRAKHCYLLCIVKSDKFTSSFKYLLFFILMMLIKFHPFYLNMETVTK